MWHSEYQLTYKMRCAVVVVILFCFTTGSTVARFLLRASDNNMTNGDFAFFTWYPSRGPHLDRPWSHSRYVKDPQLTPRLQQAYTVVKQASYLTQSKVPLYSVHCDAADVRYFGLQKISS